MDILMNLQTGDAVFHNGPLTKEYTTQPYTQTVQQRLYIRLRTFLGEWFLNTAYGVPYWQRILGKKITKSETDRIFQEQILSDVGVAEILSFKSSFVNRVYSLSFTARCRNGETLSLTINDIGA